MYLCVQKETKSSKRVRTQYSNFKRLGSVSFFATVNLLDRLWFSQICWVLSRVFGGSEFGGSERKNKLKQGVLDKNQILVLFVSFVGFRFCCFGFCFGRFMVRWDPKAPPHLTLTLSGLLFFGPTSPFIWPHLTFSLAPPHLTLPFFLFWFVCIALFGLGIRSKTVFLLLDYLVVLVGVLVLLCTNPRQQLHYLYLWFRVFFCSLLSKNLPQDLLSFCFLLVTSPSYKRKPVFSYLLHPLLQPKLFLSFVLLLFCFGCFLLLLILVQIVWAKLCQNLTIEKNTFSHGFETAALHGPDPHHSKVWLSCGPDCPVQTPNRASGPRWKKMAEKWILAPPGKKRGENGRTRKMAIFDSFWVIFIFPPFSRWDQNPFLGHFFVPCRAGGPIWGWGVQSNRDCNDWGLLWSLFPPILSGGKRDQVGMTNAAETSYDIKLWLCKRVGPRHESSHDKFVGER